MTARVDARHVYPVKGMRGRALDRATVLGHGLAGDRRWLVVDENGSFLTQRQVPAMARLDAEPVAGGLVLRHGAAACAVSEPGPGAQHLVAAIWKDKVPVLLADGPYASWLSAALGRSCRLAYLDDERARPVDPEFGRPGDHVGFADAFPLLATSNASLTALNDALERPVPMDRFRPSVTVSGLPAWSEDRWRRVRIGAVSFRAPNPCTRCVVITRDQRSGLSPPGAAGLRPTARWPHPAPRRRPRCCSARFACRSWTSRSR